MLFRFYQENSNSSNLQRKTQVLFACSGLGSSSVLVLIISLLLSKESASIKFHVVLSR